jgi:hypothetical protein
MKDNDMEMPGNNETPAFTGSSPVVGTILVFGLKTGLGA